MSKLEELKKTMKKACELLDDCIDDITPIDVDDENKIRTELVILTDIERKAHWLETWSGKFADIRENFLDWRCEVNETQEDFKEEQRGAKQ